MIQITLNIDINAPRKEVLNLINANLPIKGRRGKSDSADHVKALSALRLLEHFEDWEKAYNHVSDDDSDKTLAPFYAHREQWSRAASDARSNIPSVLSRLL